MMRTTKLTRIMSVISPDRARGENLVQKKKLAHDECCSSTVNVVCFQNPSIPRFIFLPVTDYINFK